MGRIFKRGQLKQEAEAYRNLLLRLQRGHLTLEELSGIHSRLFAMYGREGFSRIKARAWKP